MVAELIPAASFPSSIQTKSNLKPLRPVSELSRLLFRSTHSSLQTVLLFYSADSSDDTVILLSETYVVYLRQRQ